MRVALRIGVGTAWYGAVLVGLVGLAHAADEPPPETPRAERDKIEPLPPTPLLLEQALRGLFEAAPGLETLEDFMQRASNRNRAAAEAAAEVQRRQLIRQQARHFEQFLQPLLGVELALVRDTCGSLPAAARREVLAASRRAVGQLAEEVARRQMDGQGGTDTIDVRQELHRRVAAALEPLAAPEEFAAYQRESLLRQERRAEAARLRIVAKLDQQLGLTAAQRGDVLEDLRIHWQADWIRELENHDGVLINDQPPAPDFAAARIVPHLDPVQRMQWDAWARAAAWDAVPRGGIDWGALNALQQHSQKIDAWWRP